MLQQFVNELNQGLKERTMKTYTPEQLAEILGVPEHSVHYLWRKGLIPKPILQSHAGIRWSAAHIDRYLQVGMTQFSKEVVA